MAARRTTGVTVRHPLCYALCLEGLFGRLADLLIALCRMFVVWSNFEIGDLNFWRSEAYMKFFEHLDEAGGFYYERWVSSCVCSDS
jgi:hypothetical protein